MSTKRKVEIYSAGCPACQEAIDLVNHLACPSCEVSIRDMHDGTVAAQAKSLGIQSVPAVVVDGNLLDCCGKGPNEDRLRNAGIGQLAV